MREILGAHRASESTGTTRVTPSSVAFLHDVSMRWRASTAHSKVMCTGDSEARHGLVDERLSARLADRDQRRAEEPTSLIDESERLLGVDLAKAEAAHVRRCELDALTTTKLPA